MATNPMAAGKEFGLWLPVDGIVPDHRLGSARRRNNNLQLSGLRPHDLMNIFVFILLCLLSVQSFACSPSTSMAVADRYARAEAVALVKITSTRLVVDKSKRQGWDDETVEATYEVMEAFKGTHRRRVVHGEVFYPGNCSIPVLAGNTFILFIQQDGQVDWPGGSRMIWSTDADDAKPVLAELRLLKAQ